MNLFKGVIRNGPKPFFETSDGTRLPLAKVPAGSDGRAAICSARPEHFSLGGDLNIAVTVIEPTGSETQVIGKRAKRSSACSANASARSLARGWR